MSRGTFVQILADWRDVIAPRSIMQTLDLLPELGFTEKPDRSGEPEYEIQLGGLRLSGAKRVNRYYHDVILFSGHYVTSHRIGEVNFEVPVELPSLDHLKAFLSYYLKSDISGPAPAIPKPFWFDEGISFAHLLPWV